MQILRETRRLSLKFSSARHCWPILLACVLALSSCSGSSENGEEGGIVGTGIIGVASEPRSLASNAVEIKAFSGERFSAELDSDKRYRVADLKGEGPWVVRTTLDVNDYHYSIAYEKTITNINSYSDVVLRNWFARANLDIDASFAGVQAFAALPSQNEFLATADSLFALVGLVLDSYGVLGSQILSGNFLADDTGIDDFIDKNPVIVDGEFISILLTDPKAKRNPN